MGSNKFQWLIMSVEKDDICIIDAESDMWGERTLAEKLLKTEGKQVVLFKDQKLRTYLVVKQGVGNMNKLLEDLKQEYGLSCPSETQLAVASNLAKEVSQKCKPMDGGDRNKESGQRDAAKTVPSESIRVVQCCEKHQFAAEVMLEDEKRVHEIIKVLEQTTSQAAEELACLKRKLNSVVKGVVGDLEYAESDLADSTETRSLDSSDEGHEENQEDSLEAAAVYKQVEAKPPVQFGLNNKNLDLIYSGHQPWAFGLALRKWIFGVNGLAYEMILPTKQQGLKRTCVSMEKMLVFFRAVERKFPKRAFPDARKLASRAANKAGLNAKQRMEKTGKYSADAKLRKQEARKKRQISK